MPRGKANTKPKQGKRLSDPKPVFVGTLGSRGRRLNTPEAYRRPTQRQLLQRYFRWAYRCITLNAQTAAANCPRLFSIGNRGTIEKCHGLKPKKLDVKTKHFLRGQAFLKPGAVAQKRIAGNIEDMTEITDHPALMLLDNVNEWEEGFGFRESWYTDLQLYGKFFSSIVADPSNVPIALWRLLPHYTQVLPDPAKFIAGFEYGTGAERVIFQPDEVFWVKLNDPMSPWDGMSPTEAWLKSLDADNAIVAFQEWIFNRGGTPDVLIVSKTGLNEDQKRAFRKDWQRMFGRMTQREESIGFVSGETEVIDLGNKPKDMQYVEGREISRDEICNAYGTPKAMVTTDDVNLANAREGSITHQRNTIWPLNMRVEDAVNQRFLPRWSDRLVLIHDNPVAEDETIRIQRDDSDIRQGWTPNELRVRRGEESVPDPEMDVRYIASDLIPMRMAGQTVGLDGLSSSVAGMPPRQPEGANDVDDPASSASSPDAKQPATVLPPVPLTDGLELLRAYYAREIPREAAINLAQTSLRMTPEQADVFIPEIPPDAPLSPEDQATHDATIAVQDATAAGKIKPNERQRDTSKSLQDIHGRAVVVGDNGRPDQLPAESDNGDSKSGRIERVLDSELERGAVRTSFRSTLFKAWEGVEHENETKDGCNHRGRSAEHEGAGEADEGDGSENQSLAAQDECSHLKCWSLHLKDDKKPGKDEPQEGLPDNGSVNGFTRNMDKTLRAQVEAILASMAVAPMTAAREAVTEAIRTIVEPKWIDEIADNARPFINRGVDIGGRFGMERLEQFRPIEVGFDVTNPEVQKFVDKASVKLATEVNGHTEVRMREILGDGLDKGESIPELTKRVEDWAGKAGDAERGTLTRAENIARTESSRAYVAGEKEAWKQSGVVKGYKWLLAPDACSLCQTLAAQFNAKTTAMGEPFLTKGSSVRVDGELHTFDYADVQGGDAHPQCRCDIEPVLEDE